MAAWGVKFCRHQAACIRYLKAGTQCGWGGLELLHLSYLLTLLPYRPYLNQTSQSFAAIELSGHQSKIVSEVFDGRLEDPSSTLPLDRSQPLVFRSDQRQPPSWDPPSSASQPSTTTTFDI